MMEQQVETTVQLPAITELPLSTSEMEFLKQSELFAQEMLSKYSPKVTKGTWSPVEAEKLKEAVNKSVPIVWDGVAENVPGRTATQCKERWLYRLDPAVKKTRFEQWEDEIIVRERLRIGNRWTLISNLLPGRTSQSVKNRWYSVLRNRYELYY